MLYSHSKSHGHFVANSSLVNTSCGGKSLHGVSPTSGNLSSILSLLSDICIELNARSLSLLKLLLLQWASELLIACKPCTTQLSRSDLFQRFLVAVARFATLDTANQQTLALATRSLLTSLLDLPDIMLQVTIFNKRISLSLSDFIWLIADAACYFGGKVLHLTLA